MLLAALWCGARRTALAAHALCAAGRGARRDCESPGMVFGPPSLRNWIRSFGRGKPAAAARIAAFLAVPVIAAPAAWFAYLLVDLGDAQSAGVLWCGCRIFVELHRARSGRIF